MEQFNREPIWSNEQESVINSPPNRIITGIAGSGKTLLACHLAMKYSKESDVLFLVYTKALSAFVQSYLNSFNAYKVYVQYEYQWKKRDYTKYGLVIIDEFQDFSSKDIQYAISQASIGIYIFGDENQRLYERNYHEEITISLKGLVSITNYPVSRLTSQYRVPYENGILVAKMFNLNITKKAKAINKYPTIKHFESILEEIQWLIDYLKKTKYSNIGILLKQNDSVNGQYHYNKAEIEQTYPGIIELHKILEDAGIEHGYKYRNSENLKLCGDKRINILTYHSAKGLLFDCVILPFSSKENNYYKPNVSYVAMTRSAEKLIITYSCIITSEYYLLENTSCYKGKIRTYSPLSDISDQFWRDLFHRE